MKYMSEVCWLQHEQCEIRVTSRCRLHELIVGFAPNNIEDVWDTVGYFLIALSSTELAPSSAMIPTSDP